MEIPQPLGTLTMVVAFAGETLVMANATVTSTGNGVSSIIFQAAAAPAPQFANATYQVFLLIAFQLMPGGCSDGGTDSDGDSVPDCRDNYPFDSSQS